MRKLSADWIFPVVSAPVKNGILVINENGKIETLLEAGTYPEEEVERFKGILCPGFVNTHCHLELSHMRGLLKERTGLIEFISGVLAHREAQQEVIQNAISRCDKEMQEGGIVAVGDISNTADTFRLKTESPIDYHTFVEIFILDPGAAQTTFEGGRKLHKQLIEMDQSASIAPHAPYTVSPELFRLIDDFNATNTNFTSIHNQETEDENRFFLEKKGMFVDFYEDWGSDISFFKATGKNALASTLPYMPKTERVLLVHNTFSTRQDVAFANQSENEIFWCTNPNANLYIENRIPDYSVFLDTQATVTLGTDSIASNWQLSVLEEMKTITKHRPDISLETLLKWGTLNGAIMLGLSDKLGSFEVGKKPGINLLKNMGQQSVSLNPNSEVVKIV